MYLLLLLALFGCSSAQETCEKMFIPDPIIFSRPGDLNLAYIAQLTTFAGDRYCARRRTTGRKAVTALQYADLVPYAISQINQNDDILPNVTLGFTVMDGCSSWRANLARVWNLLLDSCHGIPFGKANGKLIGVVGPLASSTSTMISGTLGLHHMPHIGIQATSDELSDKAR